MKLIGTIKVINPTQKISDKFSKRELVIVTNEDYPQTILVQFTQDKCAILDKYKSGEQVEISINLKGREYKNPRDSKVSYFNTIEGWKIDYSGEHANALHNKVQKIQEKFDTDSDLPF